MKSKSDNFRQSSIQDILNILFEHNANVIIYEPISTENNLFCGFEIISDINEFKNRADIIVANRYDSELDDVKNKVYTRDLYNRD